MSLRLKAVLATICLVLAACADGGGQGGITLTAPHTDNEALENETAPEGEQPGAVTEDGPSVLKAFKSEIFYVYATQLRVRTTAEITADASNVAGMLNTNDEVKTLGPVLENGMIQIMIVKTAARLKESDTYFVSAQYLSKKRQDARLVADDQFKYFMVQNIASEKMRVYERQCDDGSCAHKMIFETNIAVGEYDKKKLDLMTISGNFHLVEWIKFYQDGAGAYPSWYDPGLPMPPGPGAGVTDWTSSKVKPKGSSVRGAFGWYMGRPGGGQTNYQWTHGTLGWGKDKDKYIKATRGFWANLFLDPRSHGCSRTDNQSIAYLRHLLPPKVPMVKIYAREAYADPSLAGYSEEKQKWEYILTKNGVRQSGGQTADREAVLRAGTPASQWLEEGVYEIDAYPEVRKFKGKGGRGASNGKHANVYGLSDGEMSGYFLVDAGLVVDYKNPGRIVRGGYKDKLVPDFMVSKSSTFVVP